MGPGGCERCKGSGYKGRVGIYQVMPISEEIARIIMTGGNLHGHRRPGPQRGRARPAPVGPAQGAQGITSLEEVLATTNE